MTNSVSFSPDLVRTPDLQDSRSMSTSHLQNPSTYLQGPVDVYLTSSGPCRYIYRLRDSEE